MSYCQKDLRSYLSDVDRVDRVYHISKSVDLHTELPALCSEARKPLVFENIKGFEGWRVADALLTSRQHQAIALGCTPDKVVRFYADRMLGGPGQTCVVNEAPVKEVVWTGEQASLHRLPVHDVAVPMRSCINAAFIQMSPNCREEVRDTLLTGMSLPFMPRLTVAVDEDVDLQNPEDLLYPLAIRVDPTTDIITLEQTRSFDLEPQTELIPGLEQSKLRSGSRWAIDATKPPLGEPEKRKYFERLKARGEGKVSLSDFLD